MATSYTLYTHAAIFNMHRRTKIPSDFNVGIRCIDVVLCTSAHFTSKSLYIFIEGCLWVIYLSKYSLKPTIKEKKKKSVIQWHERENLGNNNFQQTSYIQQLPFLAVPSSWIQINIIINVCDTLLFALCHSIMSRRNYTANADGCSISFAFSFP